MHTAHDRTTNKCGFNGHLIMLITGATYHMRVTGLVQHLDVVQLKVQELIHTLQRALNGKVIL